MVDILIKLEKYYGNSKTFSGKHNGFLEKILSYKFQKCKTCNTELYQDVWKCTNCSLINPKEQSKCSACFTRNKNNPNICKKCLDNRQVSKNNIVYELYLCPGCDEIHQDENREYFLCEICNIKHNVRFYNINQKQVCYFCTHNRDEYISDSDEDSDITMDDRSVLDSDDDLLYQSSSSGFELPD